LGGLYVWHHNPAFGSSHSASPAYQAWPTHGGPTDHPPTRWMGGPKAHSEFESGGRGIRPPLPQSLTLPHRSGRNRRCDPEGTFGRNQQLTDSMSLSPLHPSETSDLHVNNAYQPPMQFPASSMSWGEVRRFSGIPAHTLPEPQRPAPSGTRNPAHEGPGGSPSRGGASGPAGWTATPPGGFALGRISLDTPSAFS